MYNIEELDLKLLSELRVIAEKMNVSNFKKLQKKELVYKILDQQALNPTIATTVRKEVASESTFLDNAETIIETESNSTSGSRAKRSNVKAAETAEDDNYIAAEAATPIHTTAPTPARNQLLAEE
jgi:transcription termination factor Rho